MTFRDEILDEIKALHDRIRCYDDHKDPFPWVNDVSDALGKASDVIEFPKQPKGT